MNYKVLKEQIFTHHQFSIVPIRFEDRYAIRQWRNEQLYHLRQREPLTKEAQDAYFTNVVAKLFDAGQPDQLLFSYLEGDTCIGYGGLVHINREDQNAEISFIMDTRLEEKYFAKHWSVFLGLIEQVAFGELNLHKIYTYAFDLRPHLFSVLEENHYIKEGRLRGHKLIGGAFRDVLIHAKLQTCNS